MHFPPLIFPHRGLMPQTPTPQHVQVNESLSIDFQLPLAQVLGSRHQFYDFLCGL